LGSGKGLFLRFSGRNRAVQFLNRAGKLVLGTFQLAALVRRAGLLGFQRGFLVLQFLPLGFQFSLLIVKVGTDSLVFLCNVGLRLPAGQQLEEIGRTGKQRDAALVVELLHADRPLFAPGPACVEFLLFGFNLRLFGRDRVLSFADLGLQLGDQIRDNRHLLHQHILPGLRVGAAGLSAFKVFLVFFALFLDGVQFLLQAVLFGFQLLLAIIGT